MDLSDESRVRRTPPRADATNRKVLVADAQALGMIGVVRSLGRAGYQVHAASRDPHALGLQSNFAAEAVVHPPYGSPQFRPWLDAYLAQHGIDAIVPSEGFLHAVLPDYGAITPLLPDAAPREVVERCLSKVLAQRRLLENPATAVHLPQGGIVSDEDPPLPDGASAGPFYLKGDARFSRGEATGEVVRCADRTELARTADALRSRYRALLWQAHVPGLKVGVSLWRHDGRFLGESMVLGIHQQPHTGGMMSLRRTWWHERILADARAKMEALGWSGVAMMEYKWDPASDDFWFIEINARYWGYLHLDLAAGKDFPRLQMDAFFGTPREDLGPAKRRCVCRNTFPGETGYLLSRLRDPGVGGGAKLASCAGFALRFLDPRITADLLFPGDRVLYLRGLRDFLQPPGRRGSPVRHAGADASGT